MEDTIKKREPPLFEVIESSPRLLSAHAQFMTDGGDRLLIAMQNTVQPGLWPWDKPAEHTAQYGAFCAGVAWACRMFRDLNLMVQNRAAMLGMITSALSSDVDDERVRDMLKRDYGYTDADFEAAKLKKKEG